MSFSPGDLDDLRLAKRLLEHPSLAAKLTSLLGEPIERGFALLPARWTGLVTGATHRALQRALRMAIGTLDEGGSRPAANRWHKVAVAATGAGGGAFGLAALPVELPISTTVMLRSIADVARSEGERIRTVDAQLACLEVFALGGRPRTDDSAETGYFAVRVALARAVSEAAEFIAERGLVQDGAPAIVRLIAQISSRFGVDVSEKAAAQAIPVIGAAGGAAINLLFVDHFQAMARGHFIVRRLERTYGAAPVRAAYEARAILPSAGARPALAPRRPPMLLPRKFL
ncbi:MAG TPA: EcsC family protein [Vicinamibacterales bacterium]|nr:EcsC family protein [Vicinamibacterales bacterium]